MTVSRVIRGNSGVRPQTRERVLRAMQTLGYVPSPAARAMRSKDQLRASGATCFALVFGADTAKADGFFCDVARAAEAEAAQHGLCPLHVHWQDSAAVSWPRLQSVFSVPTICGAILVGQFARDEVASMLRMTERLVMVDGPVPGDLPVAAVESDNAAGCRLAMTHLLEGGSRRILVLTGPPEHYFSQAMASGVQAFRDRCEMLEIVPTDYTAESGRAAVERLWANGRRFDGIFGNDELAIGALKALHNLRVAVPADVRVVGFDDIPHAALMTPGLTTVRIDKRLLGSEAVKCLVDITRGNAAATELKKIAKAELIVRDSA